MELNTMVSVLCKREYDFQYSNDFEKLLSIINVYLLEKQQFNPLYSYQKFLRSGQKIRERSQANGYFEK